MAWQAGKDLFVKEGERTYNPLKLLGGRTRIRTLDPLIKSQLLYQLSYAP